MIHKALIHNNSKQNRNTVASHPPLLHYICKWLVFNNSALVLLRIIQNSICNQCVIKETAENRLNILAFLMRIALIYEHSAQNRHNVAKREFAVSLSVENQYFLSRHSARADPF